MTSKKKKVQNPESLIVNQIVIRSADRSSKDIADWRLALQSAENVYYPLRTRLYDLYADVILDGHLSGIMQRRIDAVLNKNLHFNYEKNEGNKINGTGDGDLNSICESIAMRGIMKKIIESFFWGISGIEFIPGSDFTFEEIPRKHIKPELGIISKDQNMQDGWSYENMELIWVIGEKKDLGLLLKCSPYALWKRGNLADWAQYVEIFGQPVRIIKYDAYDLKTKQELKNVMDEAGSSLALLIPKQADFDMKDGKQSNGDGKLQELFRTACNEEMSVIILTVTETTTSSKKSGYAQSKEHGKQQLDVTKSDLKFVENCLNSDKFLRILQTYGFDIRGKFEFEKEVDLAELLDRQTIDDFVSKQVPVGDDYYYETYGIPKPENYDELKKKMEEEQQTPPMPPASPIIPKQKKNKPEKLVYKQKFWDKFRTQLADFFDPAP